MFRRPMIAFGAVAMAVAGLSIPTRFGDELCFLPSWKDGGPALAIADPGGPGKGAVWIVDLSGALVTRLAGAADEAYGQAIAGGADLDGDGASDLLVGSSRGEGEAEQGFIALVSGKSGEVGWSIATPPSPGVTHLVTLDDVDGDGLADVCVALPTALDHAGVVRICRGKDGATLAELVGAHDDGLGWGVVGIDDVDGDGIGDLALASVYENCVRIYTLPALRHLRDLERPDRKRSGLFGASMAAAEGVLLIQQSGPWGGAAFLVSTSDWRTLRTFTGGRRYAKGMAFLQPLGGVGAPRVLIAELGKGFEAGGVDVFAMDREVPLLHVRDGGLTSGFGACMVGIGDVDEDGEPDFAVGAGGYPGAKVEVFSGSSGARIRTIERRDLEAAAQDDGR